MNYLRRRTTPDRAFDHFLAGLSLLIFWSAFVYFIYRLNWAGLLLSLLLAAGSFYFLRFQLTSQTNTSSRPDAADKKAGISLAAGLKISGLLILYFLLWRLLSRGATDRTLISPWEMLSASFFWLYAGASLLLANIVSDRRLYRPLPLLLLSMHCLLSFSVAASIYRLGYGFDPFIHHATMELIAEKGYVLPKTFYYLGQYGLLVSLHKLSHLPLHWLNTWLVPLAAAALLPYALWRFLLENPQRSREPLAGNNFLTILFLLILTYAPFILTTPQNFSYLFLALTVLTSFRANRLYLALLLALATAAIHPLTGLAALAWCAWIAHQEHSGLWPERWRALASWTILAFAALAQPVTLFIAGGRRLELAGGWPEVWTRLIGTPGTAGREDWITNTAYLFAHNHSLFLLLACLAAAGAYIYSRKGPELISQQLKIVGALLLSYLCSSRLRFSGLIEYEQNGYAGRIPIIIAIFFLPLLALGLRGLIIRIRAENQLTRSLWLAAGSGLLVISLYLSYPRFDRYYNSRGYSTGANDVAAVQSIESRAEEKYIALANQQVSAAALQSFGFGRYLESPAGPLYFYPIPTGGPLYQSYLKMVYQKPDRSTMREALDLAGVEEGYLVVNKYWHQSGRIINEAKLAADEWWSIDDQVYVFRYRR